MTNKWENWYDVIIEEISHTNTDVLFVIDSFGLLNLTDIKVNLEKVYKIVKYQNELRLRRDLRSLKNKTIFKFDEESQIPYDLFSSQATLEISTKNIFPFLNSDIISTVPINLYQQIFQKYEKEKIHFYDKLSSNDTKNFLDKIIYNRDIEKTDETISIKEKLNELLGKNILSQQDWGHIAKLYGNLNYILKSKSNESDLVSLIQLRFKEFISNHYHDMIYDNQAPLNSNILNLIFNYTPTALICFDCMGFEEWNVIKNYLASKTSIQFDEKYSFSIIPSDTKFSRTALFSGVVPLKLNENAIKNPNEKKLFTEYLNENFGISENDIYYLRCSDPNEIPIDYAFEDYKAVGIIFSFIDEFVHNKKMNKLRIVTNLENYLEETNLAYIILSLIDKGFRVYLSSDHGNVFAHGNGIMPRKDLFNSRANRYLMSAHKNILLEYMTENKILIQLKDIIGEDFILLLADNSMFNTKGKTGLTHGGISVEEVVLPFIEVKKE